MDIIDGSALWKVTTTNEPPPPPTIADPILYRKDGRRMFQILLPLLLGLLA